MERRRARRPPGCGLAKLGWRLESRSEVQWRDCVEIAAIQSLDQSYMRTWSARLGITADLQELLEQTAR